MERNIIFKEDALTPEIFSRLSESAGWATTEMTTATKAVNGTRYAVCAFDGEKCVGMARLIGDGAWSWVVEHVVVLPEYQKKQIGTQLMQYIMAHLKTRVPTGQAMMVTLIAAEGKEPFYNKFGFNAFPNDQMKAQPMRILLVDNNKSE